MTIAPATLESQPPRAGLLAATGEIALLWLVFYVIGGWPPPDPNEAHFIGKALHYWDPDWIRGDYFLDSSEPHFVFYALIGWLPRLVSLSATAWIGRGLSWALIAGAWQRLSWAVLPRWGWTVLSGSLMAVLVDRTQMAGEWLIGGFESKPIAYALVLFALAQIVRDRWNRGWLLLGLASLVHPVVGGWSVVATGLAWSISGPTRPKLVSMWPGLVGGGLIALVGLVPVLLSSRGVPPEIAAEGYRIYVFERLAHHCLPQSFAPRFLVAHGLALVAFLVLCRLTPFDRPLRIVRNVVIGSLVIALVGFGLAASATSQPAFAASVLRFYWFRLNDVLLPVGLALLGCVGLRQLLTTRRPWGAACLGLVLIGLSYELWPLAQARLDSPLPRADGPGKVANFADWVDVCDWIEAHTPHDARFLTPRSAQTFKWYAQRAEVATWKDMPQRADELVEWRRRMNDVYGTGLPPPERRFFLTLAEEGKPRLVDLGRKYGAGYVLTEVQPPLELVRLYSNRTYAVYKLPAL